jgi:type I restriction enzyme R subunit
MIDTTTERVFQDDLITQMCANGWVAGSSSNYQRETALYQQDVLDFIQKTQAKQWQKFCKIFPMDSERHFIEALVLQLKKADINATDQHSRTYGTLGVLRHGLKIRNARFSLCQFKPEHRLNPDTLARYQQNICRIVPELVYSPYATAKHKAATGKKSKAWRIDLVLFINGLPVITMELKSEFKQAIENAKRQYIKTRLPKDPATKKLEPLLSFKRGALVHFAVSQYEVFMTTRLAGDNTYFLPLIKALKQAEQAMIHLQTKPVMLVIIYGMRCYSLIICSILLGGLCTYKLKKRKIGKDENLKKKP